MKPCPKCKKKTWCQLSEKELSRRNPEGKTLKCTDSKCFSCYGDSLD